MRPVRKILFSQTPLRQLEFVYKFEANSTKPKFEIYDVGMINNIAHPIDEAHIQTPVYLQFVLGILGGIPATIQNVMFLYKTGGLTVGEFA